VDDELLPPEPLPLREKAMPKKFISIQSISLALLLLQSCFLGWHLLSTDSILVSNSGVGLQMAYGNDKDFMTLDHAYDFLWEEKGIQKAGVISLSRDEDGRVKEYGAISM
jgi:hypothetical protein